MQDSREDIICGECLGESKLLDVRKRKYTMPQSLDPALDEGTPLETKPETLRLVISGVTDGGQGAPAPSL